MKLVLPDALHARPANLLVRAARRLGVPVFVHAGERRADAREILQVLGLRAAKGDEIELHGEGPEAADAIEALAQLIAREFDPDLVPETGTAAAAGVAVGEAVVLELELRDSDAPTDAETELARARGAFARAREELSSIVAGLASHERELFEPEFAILDALEGAVSARIRAGARAEEAVRAEATHGPSDLVDDARARLLEALAGDTIGMTQRLAERTGRDVIVVTPALTPSLVAALPSHVVGVIAVLSDEAEVSQPPPSAAGTTSHAAILARGRGLPLVYVPAEVGYALADGVTVVLDTTIEPARVWPDPSETLVAEARARRGALAAEASAARDASAQLGNGEAKRAITLRANVGSTRDEVPAVAEGIGLVRTELLFAGRSGAPREDEQVAAYRAIARRVAGPVSVRLFDAGGDKPLPFLQPPARDPDARGIALLFEHPAVLETQLRAISRARDAGDVRVLIPLVRSAHDVDEVRRRTPPGTPVGAMVETLGAVRAIDSIALSADFVSIGTNDLAADVLSASREAAPDPFHPAVLDAIAATVEGAHRFGRVVTVCGEVAADPRGARVLVGLGVDALSVACTRLPGLALALAGVTVDECRAAALSARSKGESK